MKRVCAILCLDEQTKDKIQAYREALTVRYGVPKKKLYPHITLAHYLAIAPEDIIRYSERFAEEIYAFNIQYDSIEMLEENCIACIANSNSKITDIYNIYHAEFDSYCDIWTKKANNLWIPHCTIYGASESKLDEIKEYKAYLGQSFTPFEGKATRFELSQINEDGFEIIYSKNLK